MLTNPRRWFRSPHRPTPEWLEDRISPAGSITLAVTTTADLPLTNLNGQVTLRSALQTAAGNFAAGTTNVTINLTSAGTYSIALAGTSGRPITRPASLPSTTLRPAIA